jgi:hypothetical protein
MQRGQFLLGLGILEGNRLSHRNGGRLGQSLDRAGLHFLASAGGSVGLRVYRQ